MTEMIGASLIYCDEAPRRNINEQAMKSLIAGELIQVDRKYMDPLTLRVTGKWLILANHIPAIADQSTGFWCRLDVIPFPIEIPKKERSPMLANRIITHELPGVLNWALEGLARLLVGDSAYFCRFGEWSRSHQPKFGVSDDKYREGLQLLIECVNSGEINSLDSQRSLVAREILSIHSDRPFEMNSNWVGSPQGWICPCCERTKVQISRIGNKGQILAKSVVHRDHMGDVLEEAFNAAFVKTGTTIEQVDGKKLISNMCSAFGAYDAVLVCEDCNNADTMAKKMLAIPRDFSFSISQIRTFIKSRSHQPHLIDETQAS